MNIKELSVLSTVKLTLKDNQNKDIVLRGMFSKLTKENKHDFYGLVNRNIKKFEVIFVQKNEHQGINENKIYIKLENINRSKLPKQESEILKQVIIRNKLREVPDNLGNTLSNDSIYFDKVKKELSSKEGQGKIKTNIVLAEHLIIPDEINGIPVEHLEPELFKDLEIKKLTLGKNLKEIPHNCFFSASLTKLTIPRRIQYLGEHSFYSSKLETLTFEPNSNLKEIKAGCFINSQLKELTIPRNVERLLNFCFYRAPIEKLMFEKESNLEVIGDSSFLNAKLTTLTIPRSVQTISNSVFKYSELKKLTFEEDSLLSFIGTDAFAYAKLESLEIPRRVKHISNSCFEHSPLKTIIFKNKYLTLGTRAFQSAIITEKPDLNLRTSMLINSFTNSPFTESLDFED